MQKIAEKCYLPTNKILLDLIKEYGTAFKVSFSISGMAIEQFERYAPAVLTSFQELAATGCVEFIAETYSHSLSCLNNDTEFVEQVEKHCQMIEKYFKQKPTTFRNTELIYSDEIGSFVSKMGFKTMLTEGAKHILGWKSPNFLYCNAINPRLKVLLKNFKLSDDIAFRFSERKWCEWPLTATKFTNWLSSIGENEELINLFLDYETFGEHQWAETGIFEFLKELPSVIFKETKFNFLTPSEIADKHQPVGAIKVPNAISWADEERDLTAWLGNELQDEAFEKLYRLEADVSSIKDKHLLKDWHYLQASDHFYYMCTKWFSDGDVHKYFNPYESPYDAFINYMNILSDFTLRLQELKKIDSPILAEEREVEELIYTETDLDKLYDFQTDQLKNLIAKFPENRLTPLIRGVSKLSNVVEKRVAEAGGVEFAKALKKGKTKLKVVRRETEKRQIRALVKHIREIA